MRYFGGGIGHLQSTPPQQVPGFDPIHPGSDEMAVEDDDDDPCSGTNEDLGTVVQPSRDVFMNDELVQLEAGEDDEEDDEDSEDEGGDQTDEDEDEDEEGEDDYGYACP